MRSNTYIKVFVIFLSILALQLFQAKQQRKEIGKIFHFKSFTHPVVNICDCLQHTVAPTSLVVKELTSKKCHHKEEKQKPSFLPSLKVFLSLFSDVYVFFSCFFFLNWGRSLVAVAAINKSSLLTRLKTYRAILKLRKLQKKSPNANVPSCSLIVISLLRQTLLLSGYPICL